MEIEHISFAVRPLVETVVNLFVDKARDKGLHLAALVQDAVPAMLHGDPVRVRQILINLVSNALKVGPRSGRPAPAAATVAASCPGAMASIFCTLINFILTRLVSLLLRVLERTVMVPARFCAPQGYFKGTILVF